MQLLSFILVFTIVHGLERRLSFKKNPDCEKYNMSLYHLKAQGPNDTLHYLWDFTKRPSVFLALTDANATLSVDCILFVDGLKNSLNFTPTPKYEFFLILTKLIEFNDVNDTGILTPQTPRISYDTKYFTWTPTEEAKVDDEGRFVSLTMTGSHFLDFQNPQTSISGNFSVQLTAFGSENHDGELPRLLHSPNSTQCKLILENLSTDSGFTDSRYAVEFVLVSSNNSNSSSRIVTRKNLDDENSPGVFSMVDVVTPTAQEQMFQGAFLQWRPVMYTSKIPSIANSSETVAYNLTNVTDHESLKHSLAYEYLGDDLNIFLLEQTIVSLGVSQDGFYKSSNYTSWTFLISYGSPEEETFSLLVILVMCIGLGIPALLILVGGTYMCGKKIRRSKDELSLESQIKMERRSLKNSSSLITDQQAICSERLSSS